VHHTEAIVHIVCVVTQYQEHVKNHWWAKKLARTHIFLARVQKMMSIGTQKTPNKRTMMAETR
jgi:hypothetical protein